MPDQKQKANPPYGAFKTFLGFIAMLKEKGVPAQIDASVLPSSLSGSAQSQLRTGLRFLGLTNDGGETSPALKSLVAAYGSDNWQAALRPIVVAGYSQIIEAMNLENATLGQLATAFRERGEVRGASVLRKSIRFYLDALKAVDIKHSSHLARGLSKAAGDRPERKNGKSTPKLGQPDDPEEPEPENPGVATPKEHEARAFHLPGRKPVVLSVPTDLRAQEWDLIDSMMRGYIALHSAHNKETAS